MLPCKEPAEFLRADNNSGSDGDEATTIVEGIGIRGMIGIGIVEEVGSSFLATLALALPSLRRRRF